MWRQGDVLILPVTKLPAGLDPVPVDKRGTVLAEGEATGHAHVIRDERAVLTRDPQLAVMFLTVTGEAPVALEHDEHDSIHLPPGTYQVVRQREYSPQEIRTVVD